MLDWDKYIQVSKRFQYKAKPDDQGDLTQNIIVALADTQRAKDSNGGGQLSELAMFRIASYERQKYWRQVKRNARIISLDTIIEDADGNAIELSETLADDKALNLDAWLNARLWLYKFPERLVRIAHKLVTGGRISGADRTYLTRQRQKQGLEKSLVLV